MTEMMKTAVTRLIGAFVIVAATTCTFGVKHAWEKEERRGLADDEKPAAVVPAKNAGDAAASGMACYKPGGTNVMLRYTKTNSN